MASFAKHLIQQAEARMASLPRSTDDLDLTSLPERLDDATFARVQDIALSPLPPITPTDERHLNQCLRVMLAVLPKRNSDEVSGELFVAAYQKKLGHLHRNAVSFLADKAMEKCQWFPTIAECLEIVDDWRRDDEHAKRRNKAAAILRAERQQREAEAATRHKLTERPWDFELTQEFIDGLSPEMIRIGLACKALRENDEGKVVEWFTKPGEEPVF